MNEEPEGGDGRIPPVPVLVPTPGVPQREIVWTQWTSAAAVAADLSREVAEILRWVGLNADAGVATYPDDPAPSGTGDVAAILALLASLGLVTRLADGGYWPGRHGAAVAARCAQPVIDALARFLLAGAAEILADRWFRIESDAVAAALRIGGDAFAPPVFDELVRFLVEDGWVERRGAAHWRLTPRALAERGPAPGPDSPLPSRRMAPGGLRGLLPDPERAVDAREAARRAAGDLDADHVAVLGEFAAAADRDRLASVPRTALAASAGVSVDRVRVILGHLVDAGLVELLHAGGRGPKDPSVHMVLCLDPETRPAPADWAARLASGLRPVDGAVLRAIAARTDSGNPVATVRKRVLGRDVGCDPGTVGAAFRRLAGVGHLRIVHRGGRGRNDPTKIVLRIPPEGKAG